MQVSSETDVKVNGFSYTESNKELSEQGLLFRKDLVTTYKELRKGD